MRALSRPGKWSLCLSNQGLCCIDEFDKISDSARSICSRLAYFVSYFRRHRHPQITDEALKK
ncbi:hypothetical protein AMTRI_Chr05g62140 [Amborella trichopoda]